MTEKTFRIKYVLIIVEGWEGSVFVIVNGNLYYDLTVTTFPSLIPFFLLFIATSIYRYLRGCSSIFLFFIPRSAGSFILRNAGLPFPRMSLRSLVPNIASYLNSATIFANSRDTSLSRRYIVPLIWTLCVRFWRERYQRQERKFKISLRFDPALTFRHNFFFLGSYWRNRATRAVPSRGKLDEVYSWMTKWPHRAKRSSGIGNPARRVPRGA